jgi:PAS domain S-box-containing protein
VVQAAPVLVVDDDDATRRVLCDALAAQGLACAEAGSGEQALQWLGQNVPSLMLLDLVMPAPDGYQILRVIRAHPVLGKLPVIVMTSADTETEASRAFATGADDFVRKPVHTTELAARIRVHLRIRDFTDMLAGRERDAQVMLDLTHALSSSLDFREILFTVCRRTAEVAKVERCSIVLVRDEGDVGYVVAASDDEHLRDLAIDLTQYPEIREVMQKGGPLVIRDVRTHPLLEMVRDSIPPTAFSSLALLPIVFEDRPMGVLFLRARHELAFDEQQISLYSTIANATAIALRNARILQSLRDQTQQITFARFEAERRLRALQRYADFFDSSADGIVVIDNEGQFLFSNPRAQEITGYGQQALIGTKLFDLLSPSEHGRAREILNGFKNGIFPQGVDLRILKKDAKEIVISINFSSVMREENAALFTFRDEIGRAHV